MFAPRACARFAACIGIALSAGHATANPLDALTVRIAPQTTETKPLFVYVHGMCERAEVVCPKYGDAIGARGTLVCPRGNVACKGGGATWSRDDREAPIVYAVESAMLDHGARIEPRGVLIGWSLGAAVALEAATKQRGWWRGLVLVSSMTIEPDVEALRLAGIARVVLAAGDQDASLTHMKSVEKRLRDAGMETRWVSLGKVGHVYPNDLATRMAPALAWVSS